MLDYIIKLSMWWPVVVSERIELPFQVHSTSNLQRFHDVPHSDGLHEDLQRDWETNNLYLHFCACNRRPIRIMSFFSQYLRKMDFTFGYTSTLDLNDSATRQALADIDTTAWLQEVGHQLSDMIEACGWKSNLINCSEYLTITPTR